ncbi:MAG TPA: cation transporting ATPase C-terminal domain-containing protein, partial [bacterium]
VAALAVATVPVALPAAVASVLGAGLRRLRRSGAVACTPATADALGGVGVVVTEKAGTLTRNEMTVRELLVEDQVLEVTGDGYAPEGRILRDGDVADPARWDSLGIMLRIAALCTSSSLSHDDRGAWRVDGDPTEGALLALAAKGGAWRDDLAREHPLLAAFPLTVERRRMTALVTGRAGRPTALTKGDPDAVLALCLHQRTAAGVRPLSPADRERVLQRAEEMAGRFQRVVGLAYREDVPGLEPRTAERSLVWVGLAGLLDPPREGIAAAVADGFAAGVVPVIVTGDQREPAVALARGIGALRPGDEAICGEELDALTPEALSACVERYRVVARANAAHKLRIVRAWRARGRGVAMIGNEVNDAPALREADVGIWLGAGGSEIAAEEAALRMPDGGFAAAMTALADGRSVRAALSRAIAFLFAVAVAGTLVALAAALFGVPQALTPLRALWIALAAGAPPALALGAGRVPAGPVASLPARQQVLGREWSGLALVGGGATALVALATRLLLGRGALSAPEAGAITVAVSCLALVGLAFSCRRPGCARQESTLREDRWLFAAAALSLLLAVVVVQVPPAAGLLGIAPLGRREWLAVVLLAPLPLLAVEGGKAWLRGRERR